MGDTGCTAFAAALASLTELRVLHLSYLLPLRPSARLSRAASLSPPSTDSSRKRHPLPNQTPPVPHRRVSVAALDPREASGPARHAAPSAIAVRFEAGAGRPFVAGPAHAKIGALCVCVCVCARARALDRRSGGVAGAAAALRAPGPPAHPRSGNDMTEAGAKAVAAALPSLVGLFNLDLRRYNKIL